MGMDSSLAPEQLLPGFYSRAMNIVNRGGIVQCRPGYRCISQLPDGLLQGGDVFRPKQGLVSILFGVAGNLYISDAPFREYRQVPGVSFSPTARQLYFKLVEQSVELNVDGSLTLISPKNLLVISDGGTSPAVVFDGTRAAAQRGAGTIPLGGAMEWIADRLWVAQGARLFASDIANPISFTEDIYIATAKSFVLPSTITAMTKTPSTAQSFAQLLVFTENTTTIFQAGIRDRSQWAGTTDFQKEIFPKIGCVSQRSVVLQYGFLWWYSKQGLTNIDVAAQVFVTSSLDYADAEMQDSKARLSEDLAGIACTTYENYLLASVPHADKFNTHTWCLDSTVMIGGGQKVPAWNSFWTGTRPVSWISDNINGINRCLYFSVDYDGKNRLWEAFTPDRLDDGCSITWWVELASLNFGLPLKTKEFRYSELFSSELAGVVDIAVFWAGPARGKYKRIFTKRFNATRGTWRSDQRYTMEDKVFALKKQSRPIKTQDGRAIIAEETLSSCDVEAPAEEFRDESFQLLIVGSGPGAIRGQVMYAEPPTNTDDSGGGLPECEDETEENFVRFDGGASEHHDFRPAYEQLFEEFPVFYSVRSETVTQKGFTEVAIGSAQSVISQQDADKIASQIARRLASKRLEDSMPKIVSMGAAANERIS